MQVIGDLSKDTIIENLLNDCSYGKSQPAIISFDLFKPVVVKHVTILQRKH